MVPLLARDPATLREIYDHLDGILLPGGVDMDPCTFGEAKLPACGQIDPARDQVEIQLARWAAEEGKPVLGLCRGLQVINVALGGTLTRIFGTQKPGAIKHDYFPTPGAGYGRDYRAHDVTLADGSRLRKALGQRVVPVNSMHHQGIRELAAPLMSTATAPDGLIEGVESRADQYLVGVQWHPEVFEMKDPSARQLFQDFIDAAASVLRATELNGEGGGGVTRDARPRTDRRGWRARREWRRRAAPPRSAAARPR